jgi:hypothetical protein
MELNARQQAQAAMSGPTSKEAEILEMLAVARQTDPRASAIFCPLASNHGLFVCLRECAPCRHTDEHRAFDQRTIKSQRR